MNIAIIDAHCPPTAFQPFVNIFMNRIIFDATHCRRDILLAPNEHFPRTGFYGYGYRRSQTKNMSLREGEDESISDEEGEKTRVGRERRERLVGG